MTNMEHLIRKADEYLFQIGNSMGQGYAISRTGYYAAVPDDWGETTTRVIYETDDCTVCITEMRGPRTARENIFDMDMEVELTRGNLTYTFPKTGKVHKMKYKEPLFIKAGTLFTYEFESSVMACVFKMFKK